MNLRIAIVCGHFIPDLGYFEVHLARACSRLGHSVRVITSVKVPSYVEGLSFKTYKAGQELTPEPAYSIERLPALISAGQMVIANGVKKAVRHFDPDLIFVIGLGKVFPKKVFDMKKYRDRTVTFLGDNEHSFSDTSLRTAFAKRFLKKPVYKNAIEHSKFLYAYTESTQSIVSEQVGVQLANTLSKKLKNTTLGFDAVNFHYNESKRKDKRKEMDLGHGFTWICVSRVSPNKDFEPFLLGLAKLKDADLDFRALLVGADDQGERMLKERADLLGISDKVIILPFQDHRDLNALYNAADAAWYPMAAISNFEGLGTGLPVLLPKEKNVSHILNNGQIGSYFEKSEVPTLMLEWTERGVMDRAAQSQRAADRFEFRNIIQGILDQCVSKRD